MQIATWNVNSVRTRLGHVINWLGDRPNLDLLCLQETKVIDKDFPYAAFQELGYHVYVYGQKSYNGVALISRAPLSEIKPGFTSVLGESEFADLDDQKRAIACVLNDIHIVNLYVPNGSSLGSEKYIYKLRWFRALEQYLQALMLENRQVLICGDFNVAREDIDIYDATNREKHIMATDAERESLESVLKLGFKDAFRKFYADDGYYSWWDYRAGSFQRNHGWRIDYHFVTANLYDRVSSCEIDIHPRKQTQPSDHVPVIIEF